jgi:hypothetical protein
MGALLPLLFLLKRNELLLIQFCANTANREDETDQ